MERTETGAGGHTVKRMDSGRKNVDQVAGARWRELSGGLAGHADAVRLGCTWHPAERGGLECTWLRTR
jgi:hypothetical protein